MLIDTFPENWLKNLDTGLRECGDDTCVYLLIDGVFVPGLHKKLAKTDVYFLFEKLPGYNEATRDVSPFVVRYTPDDKGLRSMLQACGGWPMVSAICTPENGEELATRLEAWCVVEVDAQNFNFRFADTRRLPDILATLNVKQRAELTGPATTWRYIGRNGEWVTERLVPSHVAPSDNPRLDESQFAALVASNDVDVVLARASNFRCRPKSPFKSIQYLIAEAAMAIARKNEAQDREDSWCSFCLESSAEPNIHALENLFDGWIAKERALDEEGIEV